MVDVNFDTLTNDEFMELFKRMLIEKEEREKQIIKHKKAEVEPLLDKAFKIIKDYNIKVKVYVENYNKCVTIDPDYSFCIE